MVIDGSNLAYRTFHKFQNIRTLSEGKVGLVYGFIKVLQSYIELSKVFSPPEALEANTPIYNALQRVSNYAHEKAKKEFLDNSMEKLTDIMNGGKQNETH